MVRVVEAYVPGLRDRPASWHDRLQERVAASLGREGLLAAVLLIPADETLMWLVWRHPDQPGASLAAAAEVLRSVAAESGATVVDREVEGRLVWPTS